MDKYDILNCLGKVDPSYLQQAAPKQTVAAQEDADGYQIAVNGSESRFPWLAAAACLVLLVGIFAILRFGILRSDSSEISQPEIVPTPTIFDPAVPSEPYLEIACSTWNGRIDGHKYYPPSYYIPVQDETITVECAGSVFEVNFLVVSVSDEELRLRLIDAPSSDKLALSSLVMLPLGGTVDSTMDLTLACGQSMELSSPTLDAGCYYILTYVNNSAAASQCTQVFQTYSSEELNLIEQKDVSGTMLLQPPSDPIPTGDKQPVYQSLDMELSSYGTRFYKLNTLAGSDTIILECFDKKATISNDASESSTITLSDCEVSAEDGEIYFPLWNVPLEDLTTTYCITALSDGVAISGITADRKDRLLKYDASGTLLWSQEIDTDGSPQAIIECKDGSLAVFSICSHTSIGIDWYNAGGIFLKQTKIRINRCLTFDVCSTETGFAILADIDVRLKLEPSILLLDSDGNVTAQYTYRSEGYRVSFTDYLVSGQKLYLSGDIISSDDFRNLTTSLDGDPTRDSGFAYDITKQAQESFDAILLVCDLESGKIETFYRIDAAFGQKVRISEDGTIQWWVDQIDDVIYSPATSAWTYRIVALPHIHSIADGRFTYEVVPIPDLIFQP